LLVLRLADGRGAAPGPARRASALPSQLGHRQRGAASRLGEGREDGFLSVRKDAGAGVERAGLIANSRRREHVMTRKSMFAIGIVSVSLVALWGTAVSAQAKYSLKSPSGIAFSDFRGYEDWAVVSSARTDEVLKVIVANPTMIEAYKAGVPNNGQPFPDGSRIVKLQWKPKKSTEAPFVVDVPDVFTQAFVIEKDSKRFRKAAGGDTRCSTTKPHRTSSRPIPKAPQTADTRATRP